MAKLGFYHSGRKKLPHQSLSLSCIGDVTRICLCLLLVSYPLAVLAQSQPNSGKQSSGTITGTVEDQSGAVSVGVHVHLEGAGQSGVQEVLTGTNGQFSFTHVPAGSFRLTISAEGFNSQEVPVELQPGEFKIVPLIVLPVSGGTTEVRNNAYLDSFPITMPVTIPTPSRSTPGRNSNLPGKRLSIPLPSLGRAFTPDSNRLAIVTPDTEKAHKAMPNAILQVMVTRCQAFSSETPCCRRS
jgi:hypothetical protein